MTQNTERTPSSVGFGIERLGRQSLRHPVIVLMIVAVATAILGLCALRLQFDSDTRIIFRSERADYQLMHKVAGIYPALLNQVLILVEGDNLKTSEGMEAVRSLHLDLGLTEGVDHVVSLFSARHPPTGADDTGSPFVPDPIEPHVDIEELQRLVSEHPLVAGKLLPADGTSALVIATLDPTNVDPDYVAPILARVRQTTEEVLNGTGLTFGITGLPEIRDRVIANLRKDQALFISMGVLIGWLFAFWFFQEFKYVVITNIPVAVAIVGLLGGTWLVGAKINALTSMATPLVTVIALASALHLTFAIRRGLAAGRGTEKAIASALEMTGPGCVLSTLTTALALLALALVPYPFIRTFGFTAIAGALFALASVLIVLPALAYLILTRWPSPRARLERGNSLSAAVDRLCAGAAWAVRKAPAFITAVGAVSVFGLGALYLQNEPHYTTGQNLPVSSEAFKTLSKINDKLAGSSRVRILIEWPDTAAFPTTQSLDVIREASDILSSTPWITSVWSLDNVVRWTSSDGLSPEDSLRVINKIGNVLKGEVITTSPNTALVTGYFPETDASILLPRLRELEPKVEALQARWPNITIKLTGVSAVEASTSYEMIEALNLSLLTAIGTIIVLIALALRSVRAGLVSIVPNLFPIAVGGTYLYLTGDGLQFTSVVAFTIGFGMAVDSTIHYLNHYRNARRSGLDAADAVDRTTKSVGPVLVVSTVIVAMGLGTTLLSDMPMVQLYGEVSMLVLGAALVGDLLFLPAILRVIDVRSHSLPEEDDRTKWVPAGKSARS